MSQDYSEVLKSQIEIYVQEREAAGGDIAKRQAADDRFIKGLQKVAANNAAAQMVLDFMGKIPGQELDGARMILELRKGQIDKKQTLDSTAHQHIFQLMQLQAQRQMEIGAGPEEIKGRIYSLAQGVATICRLFKLDGIADDIESRYADWKPKLNVDTSGILAAKRDVSITLGTEDMKTTLDQLIQRLRTTGAGNAAGVAQDALGQTGQLPVATPLTAGGATPAPAAAPPVAAGGWEQFKTRLVAAGLTQQEAEKLMPGWKKTAELRGDKDALDGVESKAFLLRPEVRALGQEGVEKVKIALNAPVPTPP